jgi:uroporphyrin-III C-methyltransferase
MGFGIHEKHPGYRSIPELIRDFYNEGMKVVRLRAGDPMLFGGSNDDCDSLGRMNIPYEVVPGISAGVSAACSYALPVSEKYQSDSVTHLIAHEICDDFALLRDVSKLLRHGSTIVLYMSTHNLDDIFMTFKQEGVPETIPVIAVARSGWPDEMHIEGTMRDFGQTFSAGILREPAVYFVGKHLKVRNLPDEQRPPSIFFAQCSTG